MLVPLLSLVAALVITGVDQRFATAAHTPGERAEIRRIQAHFDGAIAMLESRDVSGLREAQRRNRRALTERLARYRDAGAFPRNYDFPGVPTPYFIDRKTDIRCAVAHLMDATGRADLVRRVAAMDNNVWVPELAGHAEFEAWLDEQGITLDEAARNQVPYMDVVIEPLPPTRAMSTGVSGTALGLTLGTATLAQLSADLGARRSVAVLGLATSTFALVSGGSQFQRGGDRMLGTGAVIGGIAGLYVARQTFGRFRNAQREAQAGASTSLAQRTRISPILPVTAGQGAGLSVSINF